MKNTVLQRIFLVNYILLILYMSWHLNERQTELESRIPITALLAAADRYDLYQCLISVPVISKKIKFSPSSAACLPWTAGMYFFPLKKIWWRALFTTP